MSEELILKELAKHPNIRQFDFFHNMGLAYYQKRRYPEGGKWLQKALQVPNTKNEHYKVYNLLGAVYDDMKRYDEAIANYTKCIEL